MYLRDAMVSDQDYMEDLDANLMRRYHQSFLEYDEEADDIFEIEDPKRIKKILEEVREVHEEYMEGCELAYPALW